MNTGKPVSAPQVLFYGTLRDPEIRRIVLGDTALERIQLTEIVVPGRVVYALDGERIVLVPDPAARCHGLLASGLCYADVLRLDYYEDGDYSAQSLDVTIAGQAVRVWFYGASPRTRPSAAVWDFESWCRAHKAAFVPEVAEMFAGYEAARVSDGVVCLSRHAAALWEERI